MLIASILSWRYIHTVYVYVRCLLVFSSKNGDQRRVCFFHILSCWENEKERKKVMNYRQTDAHTLFQFSGQKRENWDWRVLSMLCLHKHTHTHTQSATAAAGANQQPSAREIDKYFSRIQAKQQTLHMQAYANQWKYTIKFNWNDIESFRWKKYIYINALVNCDPSLACERKSQNRWCDGWWSLQN